MRFQTHFFPVWNATSPGNTACELVFPKGFTKLKWPVGLLSCGATTSKPVSAAAAAAGRAVSAGCRWQNKGTLRVDMSPGCRSVPPPSSESAWAALLRLWVESTWVWGQELQMPRQ